VHATDGTTHRACDGGGGKTLNDKCSCLKGEAFIISYY
jgi:hypothetical protein